MADSDEAQDLRRRARRRLIGAIALVLALVIIPPMVMDLDPKPVKTSLNVQIPSQESARLAPPGAPGKAPSPPPAAGSVEPRVAASPAKSDVAPPAPADASPSVPEAAKSEATKPPTEPQKPAAKSDAAARAAPQPAKKDAEAKRAEAILNGESFVIPLGAFANRENVKQLEGKLVKAGVKYYTESVTVSGAEQTRVRAGPYASKEDAEKAREKLQTLGLSPGTVVARQ